MSTTTCSSSGTESVPSGVRGKGRWPGGRGVAMAPACHRRPVTDVGAALVGLLPAGGGDDRRVQVLPRHAAVARCVAEGGDGAKRGGDPVPRVVGRREDG